MAKFILQWRFIVPDQHSDVTAAPANPQNNSQATAAIEFNWPLYVHKKRLQKEEFYRYTIAEWKGTTLVSLCLLQPLETAVQVLAELLRNAGTSCVKSPAELNSGHDAAAVKSGRDLSRNGSNGDARR